MIVTAVDLPVLGVDAPLFSMSITKIVSYLIIFSKWVKMYLLIVGAMTPTQKMEPADFELAGRRCFHQTESLLTRNDHH